MPLSARNIFLSSSSMSAICASSAGQIATTGGAFSAALFSSRARASTAASSGLSLKPFSATFATYIVGFMVSRNSGLNTNSSSFDHEADDVRGECRRSEEHTSELQSRQYLVCRLLLEK